MRALQSMLKHLLYISMAKGSCYNAFKVRGTGICLQTDSYQRGEWTGYCMKEGEGISQSTYMHDPQTQTTVW